MKLAIPTHDGITITPAFRQARGFLVCTLEFGEVVREEMRWNLLSEMLTTKEGFYYNLEDCDIIVAQTISEHSQKKLTGENKQVIITDEDLVTNILLHFRDHEMVRESNLTCCP